MNLIKKLWKDPVWSKVIATGIILLIGWLFNWYTIIWNGIVMFFDFVISFYQIALIILLIIIIVYQFYTNKKNLGVLSRNKKKEFGLEWFSKLDEINFQKYFFLLWFPINHRVQTHNMFHNESLNHIPEVKELFAKKVLIAQPISGIEYVIEINKNVYDYLDEIYLRDFKNVENDMKQIIANFKSTPFHMLFPKVKLF